MKRLLFLFSVIFYLFSCNTADDSKTKTSIADSTNTDTTKKIASVSSPVDLSKYLISKDTADAIINHHPLLFHTPKYMDSSLKIELQNQNSGSTIESIKGKYRKEDQPRYCSVRGFQAGSDASLVKNYKTVIYKLITPGAVEDVVTYYDFVTLCPPPENGNCVIVKK